MEYLAPLIQTVLWVVLIGGIVWRFNKPLHGLLTALQTRVESGSTVKAGPFELSEQVRPQGVEQQIQRTYAEVNDFIQAQAEEAPEQAPPRTEVRSRILEAEDLALREIQIQYGNPISRQVSLGSDFGIDGAFTVNGELNIVEVKYFVQPKRGYQGIRRILESFRSLFQKYHFRHVRVILAVVLHFPGDIVQTRLQLVDLAAEFDFPIDVHCYSLAELRAKFGLSAS